MKTSFCYSVRRRQTVEGKWQNMGMIAPGEEGEYKEVVKIPREFFKRGMPREVEFSGY